MHPPELLLTASVFPLMFDEFLRYLAGRALGSKCRGAESAYGVVHFVSRFGVCGVPRLRAHLR